LSVDIEEILKSLAHTSLLEELYFWSVKYEFPQKLVTFMLSLLPDEKFKVSTHIRSRYLSAFHFYFLTYTHFKNETELVIFLRCK